MSEEHRKQHYKTETGSKAVVTREDQSGEHCARANEILCRIGGELLLPPGFTAEHYVGSAAVHIYWSSLLQHMTFASQVSTLGDTKEYVASSALQDLKGASMEHYGRKRRLLRSGL